MNNRGFCALTNDIMWLSWMLSPLFTPLFYKLTIPARYYIDCVLLYWVSWLFLTVFFLMSKWIRRRSR